MQTPLFSVVMVDFEESVPREELRRGIECFCNQTEQNFELLVYHDGPKKTGYEDDLSGVDVPPNIRFFITAERENCWGHSNRDRGIRSAKGKWIVHTNADNVFYEFALKEIADVAEGDSIAFNPRTKRLEKESAIVIFPILLSARLPVFWGHKRFRNSDEVLVRNQGTVLSGVPVQVGQIDAMQLVMRRDLWLEEGGWSNLQRRSDGTLYQEFAKKYSIKQVPKVLAEHH